MRKQRVAPRLILITGLSFAFGANVVAEFIPGHVFVTRAPGKFCAAPEQTGADKIYEIDPATGVVSVFVELPVDQCKWLNGLTFTPDGQHLRAGSLITGSILEFDSEGNWEVVLGPEDGLHGPWGGNCITYDAAGNFYVADTGTAKLFQFPADGGPSVVLADYNDGIRERMSIAFAADGDLYLSPGGDGPVWQSEQFVLRFATPSWIPSLFDPALSSRIDGPRAVATDSAGYVYALMTLWSPLYRYHQGDANSRELVAPNLNVYLTALAFSQDESRLYLVNLSESGHVQLSELDVRDGSLRAIAPLQAAYTEGVAVAPLLDRAVADVNADGDSNLDDVMRFNSCHSGPNVWTLPGCGLCDLDRDFDVDFEDFARFQSSYTIP